MVLANGDTLPEIPAVDTDGAPTTINGLVEGSWSVVLFYRGHW